MEAKYEVLIRYLKNKFPSCAIHLIYEAGFKGATIQAIGGDVNGKTITLTNAAGDGVTWTWAGSVPATYVPKS